MNAVDSNPPGELYCPSCEKHFRTGERCPEDDTRLVRLGARDPFVGRTLDGRYTIGARIGQGGMGAVYRAHQHSVGRDVAVKVVNTHLVADTDVVKRFLREAKLASRFTHPNAVSVMDFGQTDDGVFYLVMELVSGRTLDVVLKDERMFRPERVVKIGAQICDALEAAHALSIVHRDLKPSNVMLLDGGRDLVKVLDFGLAKSVAPDQTSTTMTGAGMVLGTPAFMPPELALGIACDGRADLYSLGCMLFLMGSGQLPFTSESVHELMAQHTSERAPPMRHVPDALAAVIDRLLAKAPADRYQTAAETRAALEASLTMISAPVRSIIAGPHRPRSATELDQLISSNTELHTPVPKAAPAAPAASIAVAHTPRARWPWLVGGLGAAAVAAVVVVMATRPRDDAPPAFRDPAGGHASERAAATAGTDDAAAIARGEGHRATAAAAEHEARGREAGGGEEEATTAARQAQRRAVRERRRLRLRLREDRGSDAARHESAAGGLGCAQATVLVSWYGPREWWTVVSRSPPASASSTSRRIRRRSGNSSRAR